MASIKGIFTPTAKRPFVSLGGGRGASSLIKDNFTLTTLLVFGGLAQILVSLILPPRYALLPLTFLLLRAIIHTLLDLRSPANYASKQGVIPGRTSAQLPLPSFNPLHHHHQENDNSKLNPSPFPSTPANQPLLVFHLGIRFNHPLGVLCPRGKDFGTHFQACHASLLSAPNAKKYGCLGGTSYRGDDAPARNTLLFVYYFRDLEGLNRFAHDDVHRKAWDWYREEFVKRSGYGHVGIFHETFCVSAGGYESIYVDMQPTLMGAASGVVRNEGTGEEEWVRTVVEAKGPVWRSQRSRMGTGMDGKEEEE